MAILRLFWWIIKTAFKLVIVLVLLAVGYLFYLDYVTPKSLQYEKVLFKNGDYAQIKVANDWCPSGGLGSGSFLSRGMVALARKKLEGVGFIYQGDCSAPDKVNFVTILAFEFSAERVCNGYKKYKVELNAPGGVANLCVISNVKTPSGKVVSINYPINNAKSLNINIDSGLWKSNKDEILNMLKTTKYVGGGQ